MYIPKENKSLPDIAVSAPLTFLLRLPQQLEDISPLVHREGAAFDKNHTSQREGSRRERERPVGGQVAGS